MVSGCMVTAYLNALVGERKIYMAQPTSFGTNPELACRILKAMYGLRESANLWNKMFDTEFRHMGFKPLTEGPYVYEHDSKALLIMYVDDTVIAAPTDHRVDAFCPASSRQRLLVIRQPSRDVKSSATMRAG
jgi:Reverse transcriptase (RNA-dependent DNA polymerase)